MTNKVILQNLYRTTITSSEAIPASGDFNFDVAVAPNQKNGFMVIGSENASTRQIVYYHDVVGVTVYVRGINRITAAAIATPNGYSVKINDVAEIFNYLGDNISTLFYVEKMGGLSVKLWGGYVMYNNNQALVADTTLTLIDNTTNYVKYDVASNTISSNTVANGNIKCEIVCNSGNVISVLYRTSKESYLDFTISITGALPSQGGNAGKALVTDGTNVSWGSVMRLAGNGFNKIFGTDGTGNITEYSKGSNSDVLLGDLSITSIQSILGKYTQTYLMGETTSAGNPTAVCIKAPFTRSNILPYCASNTAEPDFIFTQSASYSSPTYDAFVATTGGANGWYPSASPGTHWMKIDFGNVRRIITGITTQAATAIISSGWTLKGSNDDVSYITLLTSAVNILTTPATQTFANTTFYRYYKFEATFAGNNSLRLINFDESFTTPGAVPTVYKASALDYLSANVAGFVTGAKSIGDSVDLTIAEGTPVGGFSAITKGATYFLSNTPGVLSSTPGNIIAPVGLAKSTSTILVLEQPGFGSNNVIIATGAYTHVGTGQGRPTQFLSASRFFHGGILKYNFAATTSNPAGTGVAKLQYSDDGFNSWKDIITHAGDGFVTSGVVYVPRGYIRIAFGATTNGTVYNVTVTD